MTRRRIFVFGSNLQGIHGAGAAKFARDHYGAHPGVGEGLTGEAYALPTKHTPSKGMSLTEIHGSLHRFAKFAKSHPETDFLLTAVGCGLAGFTPDFLQRIMPHFTDNVYIQARLAQGDPPPDIPYG